MKLKKGMRALSLLTVLALLTAMLVPAVSAEEQALDEEEFQDLNKAMRLEISKDVFEKIEQKQQLLSKEYLKRYDDKLEIVVNQAMLSTKTELSPSEQETLKKMIVDHIISDAEMEKYLIDNNLEENSAIQINMNDIAVDEGDSTKYPISVKSGNGDMYTIDFYQCDVDIDGGSGYDVYGNGYTVNGDNDLYKVYFWNDDLVNRVYTYQLWYLDEDHPNQLLDATYDWYRYQASDPHTYEDVALFTVKMDSPNTVHLISCYNYGVPYAALTGYHGTADRPWTSNIYVSNIWNHDIDVYDSNTNMAKSLMTVPYYLNMPTS